jgi:hypothetical protein
MINQPLRLPKKGSLNQSNKGDQRNFKEYGKPTRLNKPMAVKSTFSTVIQACRVLLVKNKGNPEEKPSNIRAAILRLPKTCMSDRTGFIGSNFLL